MAQFFRVESENCHFCFHNNQRNFSFGIFSSAPLPGGQRVQLETSKGLLELLRAVPSGHTLQYLNGRKTIFLFQYPHVMPSSKRTYLLLKTLWSRCFSELPVNGGKGDRCLEGTGPKIAPQAFFGVYTQRQNRVTDGIFYESEIEDGILIDSFKNKRISCTLRILDPPMEGFEPV